MSSTNDVRVSLTIRRTACGYVGGFVVYAGGMYAWSQSCETTRATYEHAKADAHRARSLACADCSVAYVDLRSGVTANPSPHPVESP